MLRLTLISLGVIVAAWIVVRLWRARGPMRRLADERLDEDGLRAGAEAILAARLARGEIDDATYARTMHSLWGLPAALAVDEPPAGAEAPALQPEPSGADEAGDRVADAGNISPKDGPANNAPAQLQGELPLGDAPPEY